MYSVLVAIRPLGKAAIPNVSAATSHRVEDILIESMTMIDEGQRADKVTL